ncbi:cyclic GMP-AMP synthase DncV-like nucleotidyltransferase [Vibrio sp. RC27]
MNCADLLHNSDGSIETLHTRTRLSEVILKKGILKKDELIEYLRAELSEAFDCQIGFWLQGSRKSHTLIKPVDKNSSYDIDVGVYLFFDAENEGVSATDVKMTLKLALESYCEINDEPTLQDSKNACEGLKYSAFLTIDTPIYYIAHDNASPMLATDSGWIDSDPKAIQTWLTNAQDNDTKRALMKRIVRYLKAWVNVKWNGTEHKKLPSLAINVLVARHLKQFDLEDDSFIHTTLSICEELESLFKVENPLNGQDILALSFESEVFAHTKLSELKKACLAANGASELQKSILFSELFEHYFPQIELSNFGGSTGLPATMKVPELAINHYAKDDKHIRTVTAGEVTVRKGESLTFSITNRSEFNEYCYAQWTVRNIGHQANDANDIGHKVVSSISESHQRGAAYTGVHTMECMIFSGAAVVGVSCIKVIVKPALPTVRKKKIFKGFRR